MKLEHINIENLKTTALNVRKVGKKQIADILPSIRSLGVLQPLLVRKNCEGYEIVAGQRRYFAAKQLAEEASENNETFAPLPCVIMDDGDDAKAIEASLAENIARLPMDEIDQYKAFAALKNQGLDAEQIAGRFGVSERLVNQRLAIASLHAPLLTACRKGELRGDTIRILTMATKRQQKAWWDLFSSEEEHAPEGRALKSWLFGGGDIPTTNALFNVEDYTGHIVSDLFGEEQYFDDAAKFWELQNAEIAKRNDTYLANGWADVVVLDVGTYWSSWEFNKTTKAKGGKVYVSIASDGEVTFHEGFLNEKETARLAKANGDGEATTKTARPELTKAMQNYLSLHRHSAVRKNLTERPEIALRLAVAQMIAGSSLWKVQAEPQKPDNAAIGESLLANGWETPFDKERQEVADLLALDMSETPTIVPRNTDWQVGRNSCEIFERLMKLDDKAVSRILTFVVAETLSRDAPLVEGLGHVMEVDMKKGWKPDDTFFDLLRDKQAINACLKEVAGKITSDAHLSSTAKVQKKIIEDCLNGTRKTEKTDWQPRYMNFPMKAYTKNGGIEAIDDYKAVSKHFA